MAPQARGQWQISIPFDKFCAFSILLLKTHHVGPVEAAVRRFDT